MPALLEADQIRGLDRLPPDALYEVIDGEAREIPPMGAAANIFAVELALLLGRVRSSPRDVIAVETLFALPAPVNRRRRPDVAYVPAARVPASWPPPPGEDPPAMETVPSLAVEVISPTDLIAEVEEKRREYFAVGVTTVVVVFPMFRTIHVYDSATTARTLTEADTLDLGPAVPGFSVPIADLFAPLNPPAPPTQS
jgi:Uma2 family endonuclease